MPACLAWLRPIVIQPVAPLSAIAPRNRVSPIHKSVEHQPWEAGNISALPAPVICGGGTSKPRPGGAISSTVPVMAPARVTRICRPIAVRPRRADTIEICLLMAKMNGPFRLPDAETAKSGRPWPCRATASSSLFALALAYARIGAAFKVTRYNQRGAQDFRRRVKISRDSNGHWLEAAAIIIANCSWP